MIGLIDSWDVEYNGTENEAIFKLVCDSAAELSSLTHYDSIKIRIGSECTDIATGDKYLKSSSAWVLQPSANAWENVYTKAQVDSMYNTLYQTMLYYHTTQTSTDGTITFYAFAGVVGRLKIYGNGQQTGTPTPDAPIMPTFCGVRTGNLWDEDYTGISGDLKYVPVYVGDGSFTLSTDTPDYYRNAPLFLLSGNVTSGASTPDNGVYNGVCRTVASSNGYITIAFRRQSETTSPITHNTMLNLGSTALPYEPYGYKIPLTCAGQTTPVYLGQTSTVRRIRKLVLTGEETGYFPLDIHNHIYEIRGILNSKPGLLGVGGACTHFRYNNATSSLASNMSNGDFVLNKIIDEYSVCFKADSISNEKDFANYFSQQYQAGHPVTIWYVLAEPTTGIVNEPLCKIGDYCDELHSTDGAVTIPTVNGQNTLTVDTDIAPSKIEISGER